MGRALAIAERDFPSRGSDGAHEAGRHAGVHQLTASVRVIATAH